MINKFIRDFVNLLIYGGSFIGLCAACITALSLELTGKTDQYLDYIFFIGAATAALYSAHRVIGLKKLEHIKSSERYDVIRQYKTHIWIYCFLWIVVTLWLFIPLASVEFILWLIPVMGMAHFVYSVMVFCSCTITNGDRQWTGTHVIYHRPYHSF